MNLQQRFCRLERDAAQIRAFNPVLVLGVLQTPAYAVTVLGTSQDDPLVAGRMDWQRELVADRRRRWTLIQTEGALRWQARSATVMAEQLEHLIGLSTTPHVELGVIDWRTSVEVFPHAAFHLYDDIGRFLGATVVDPAEAGRYQAARDAAWYAAEPFGAWWDQHPQYHRVA